MGIEQETPPKMQQIGNRIHPVKSVLGTALAIGTIGILLTFGFMFALALLLIIPILGVAGYAALRWKTRAIRRQMKQQMGHAAGNPADAYQNASIDRDGGTVIEGEVIREERDVRHDGHQ